MMRFCKRLFIVLFAVLFTGATDIYAQDGNNGNSGQGTEQQPVGKAARRKAKREWKEKRRKQMDDAKAKKEYNKKHNSKKVRKRMKRNEKKAKRNNEHKREFFLTRWIKKRRN